MTNSYESIEFIFAKPYSEGYYIYSVNSLDKSTLIPKDKLKTLLHDSLKCTDIKTSEFVFSRNMPFFYDNTTKKIREFQYINDAPTKKDINQKFIKEMNDIVREKNVAPTQKRYNDLFGNFSLIKNRIG